MGIIDYNLKMKKEKNSIMNSALYVIIGIFVYLIIPMGNLWKALLWIYIFYQIFTIISHLIDYHKFSQMKREEDQKWGGNFEDSYGRYKKNKSKYDQYSSSSYNTETGEDWSEFYSKKSDERKKRMYDEYERLKEEYRKKQEEYRKKQEEYYNQRYNYSRNNQYKSSGSGSGSGNGNGNITSKSEKISNAFQLLKLSPNDSEKTIKSRYRELAIKWHPDKWVTDTKENQKIAERNFQKLSAAYDLIKDYKNIK